MGMKHELPTPDYAAEVASALLGSRAIKVRRFTTGTSHFVFEVTLENGEVAVVRASTEAGREALSGNSRLTRLLRPMGVPLAEIIAEELNAPLPCLIMKRLSGSDLGEVITYL